MASRSKSWPKKFERSVVNSIEELGPGLVTGAADDDPSGIATYSQTGAQFGYALLWTIPLTYPLLAAVQLVSAHVGRVTGAGLASSLASTFPKRLVGLLIGVLLVANTINLGADLSAMAASAALVAGGGEHLFVVGFAVAIVLLQLFVPYRQYAQILKWLTLSLFSYVGVLIFVHVDWREALIGLVWPTNLGREALLTIVAVFGTTISPYLFFWQSSQEAEEITTTEQRSLRLQGRGAKSQFRRIRFDTLVGMAFSHFIAISIIIATAATLHRQGVVQIDSAAEAAQALRPIAGSLAFGLFALGIIGTGFLAVPILAGSAAFAVAEVFGWKEGLELKPQQAAGFYSIIVVATVMGMLIDWWPIDPMRALFYAAVLNGICAVPIMAAMMIVGHRRQVMGRFIERPGLVFFGWAATLVMALASGALLVSALTG